MRIAATTLCIAFGAALAPAALAKLPPLNDEAKAKAAETAARAAWTDKVGGYQLCQAQDRVVAAYRSKSPATPPAAAAPAPTPAMAAAVQASGASPTPTPAAVAATPPAPCVDPGPFTYTPPVSKPIEAAGAHSPPGTAVAPPNEKPTSAELTGKSKPETKP